MDTQNDGLEKVTPFKNGNFGYQFVRFLGCNYKDRTFCATNRGTGRAHVLPGVALDSPVRDLTKRGAWAADSTRGGV